MTIDKLKLALDMENFDGYVEAADGGVELSTSNLILSIHPDGTWTGDDFGIAEAAEKKK